MSFEDNILLKLRRQFSGKEKYRLFLQQLDRLQTELRVENKRVLELLKENLDLKDANKLLKMRNGQLQQENEKIAAELREWNATEAGKKFVSMKAYNKLQGATAEWMQRYWDLYKQLQELQKQPNGLR